MSGYAVDTGGIRKLGLDELPHYLAALTMDLREMYLAMSTPPRADQVGAAMRRIRMLEHLTEKLHGR